MKSSRKLNQTKPCVDWAIQGILVWALILFIIASALPYPCQQRTEATVWLPAPPCLPLHVGHSAGTTRSHSGGGVAPWVRVVPQLMLDWIFYSRKWALRNTVPVWQLAFQVQYSYPFKETHSTWESIFITIIFNKILGFLYSLLYSISSTGDQWLISAPEQLEGRITDPVPLGPWRTESGAEWTEQRASHFNHHSLPRTEHSAGCTEEYQVTGEVKGLLGLSKLSGKSMQSSVTN